MKVLSFELNNFASYKHIKFDMSSNGLQLIHGPTGAGKSTLCDAIPWLLFGRTAKDGSVDEVRSWFTDEPTIGTINTRSLVDEASMTITRIRGTKGNDLYYTIGLIPFTGIQRGKDIADTQRIINAHLGIDETLYLAGAYYHEFSQTAQFFTTTAKNRRLLCEQLGDLSLAKDLQTKLSDQSKILKKSIDKAFQEVARLSTSIAYMKNLRLKEETRAQSWDEVQAHNIHECEVHLAALNDVIQPTEKFQKTIARLKAKLKELPPGKCDHCGAPKASEERDKLKASIHEAEKRLMQNNQLIAQSNQRAFELRALQNNTNAHQATADGFAKDITKANKEYDEQETIRADLGRQMADNEALADIVATFRAVIIKNTITQVQDSTNSLLSDHFDAEIRIELEVEASDKLDVVITKDGNKCAYTQLSKGQRGMLKLCFSIAVMKHIAKHQRVQFNAIFLDEALDGFSETLKLKAIGLFEKLALEYDNVYVVDHSEQLKAMIDNKIEVKVVGGQSEIE